MSKRKVIYISVIILFKILVTINAQDSLEMNALKLCIEKYMQTKVYENIWSSRSFLISDERLSVIIVLIPINKEIIDTAIKYKSKTEILSKEKENDLLAKNYNAYIKNSEMAFLLVLDIDGYGNNLNNLVKFSDFEKNTVIKDEYGKVLRTVRHTRIFNENFTYGQHKGYLYFPNIRSSTNYSYSIHFPELVIDAAINYKDNKSTKVKPVFSFDESYIGFYDLLSKGINIDEIRRKYGIDYSSIDNSQVIDAIMTIIEIICK